MNEESRDFKLPPGSGRKLILGLATFTLIGFSLIGLVIINAFGEQTPLEILKGSSTLWVQIFAGIGFGIVSAVSAHIIITRKWMEPVMDKYAGLIGPMKLKTWDVIYISICAGIGEEILFRGAIQPLIGVIFTAVIFVAIHGYLNPKDARVSAYGAFMVAAMIGIGLMCDYIGILSSIIAHTVIDVYLLFVLGQYGPKIISPGPEETTE